MIRVEPDVAHVTGVHDLKNNLRVIDPTFRHAPYAGSFRPRFLGLLGFRGFRGFREIRGRGGAHAMFSVCSGQRRDIRNTA